MADFLPLNLHLDFATPLLSTVLLRDFALNRLELESFLLGTLPLPLALGTRSLLSFGLAMDLVEENDEDESFFGAAAAAAAALDLELRSRLRSSGVLTLLELDNEEADSFLLFQRRVSGAARTSLEPPRDGKWAKEYGGGGSRLYCGGGMMDGNVLT